MASETVKRQRNRKIKFCESRNSEANRKLTLKNKAKELATLCDINVCLVCFGPEGEVETWPESKAEVEQVINKYKTNGGKNVRESLNLLGFLESKKADLKRELHMIERGNFKRRKLGETSNGDWFSSLEEKIDQFSEEELLDFCYNLGHKIQDLREKLGMMQAMVTENQNQNQYSPNMGTQCYQPSEDLGWFDADLDLVLATPPVVSEASPVGYYTNIPSNNNNNNNNSLSSSMMFGNQPVLAATVDEAFSGECYVNAERCNNHSHCIPDHPVNNEDWNSNNNNNNITANDYDNSFLLLGLEDPNWFWGTNQLCFLD